MKSLVIILTTFLTFNTFANCSNVSIKGKVDCAEVGNLSVVAVEDNTNGLGLYLFEGDKQVHKSLGYGEFATSLQDPEKEKKLVVKDMKGVTLIFIRGFNSDSINNQEDGLFFNKINYESKRIVPVKIKFKSGEESDFVSISTKSKVKIKDNAIQFDKIKIEFDGALFREK